MSIFESIQKNKILVMAIIGVSVIFVLGQWFQNELFFNRSEINQNQWWRVISGNFTHSNIPHLLLNLAGLWLLGLLFIDHIDAKSFILSCAFLALSVGVGLYLFNPELNGYYGFSGILYGLYFIAAICAILDKEWFIGIAVAMLISGKIIADYFTGGSQASAELIGIPVANDAHLYGFVGAIVISAVLFVKRYLEHKK